jgi:hypothetical protein
VVGAAVEEVDGGAVVGVVEVAAVEVVVFGSGSVVGTEVVPSVFSVDVVAGIEVLVTGALVPGAVLSESHHLFRNSRWPIPLQLRESSEAGDELNSSLSHEYVH